jgi:glycyl-tRNA synthetase (class II)
MIKIETKKQRVAGRQIIPNVIEPAFGIGMCYNRACTLACPLLIL